MRFQTKSVHDLARGDEKMHHIGTKEIETDRLLLRRFTKADAQAVYTNYARDDLATKYLTWPSHQDVSVTEAILDTWVEGYGDLAQYKWAITLREQPGEALGDITASIPHEFEKIDACEIGYVLSPKLWGQGYMSEAMKAVTKYLLKEAGFNRVIARHDVANLASGKVMQKAGLQFEGIHRQGSLNNTGIIDTAQYAILKEDI
jgi:ribosomal-protein-alanine N-acetyltransferase